MLGVVFLGESLPPLVRSALALILAGLALAQLGVRRCYWAPAARP
ncbi:hypothetical protein [Pikeienuella piscinae]|nr:hypothetical protein [Pikeienuella piscinae]